MVKRVINAFLKSAYDFSSVQMDFPDEIAEEIRAWGRVNIPSEILTDNGRENTVHVTVKYGIHITDFTEVREIFKDEKPVKVILGKITLFETNDDFDVVKIDVKSPDLQRLNKKISKNFEVTDTHPVYHPHVNSQTELKIKNAYFNQSTWLPGRNTRDYPQFHKSQYREKHAIYTCVSCHLRRAAASRCPRCGHQMIRS